MFESRGKSLIHLITIVVVAVVLMLGCVGMLQERLIFFPDTLDEDEDLSWTGASQEVFVETSDGARIHGLHFEARGPSRGVILYFHGNAGSVASWYQVATRLIDHDVDVFLIDYRTYGKSRGDLSEEGLYLDAMASYQYLLDQGWEPAEIVVHGRSLGSAMATSVAAEKPVGAVILETPFSCLKSLANELYPFMIAGRLLQYRFDNLGRSDAIEAPTWVVHGTHDEIIPLSHGRAVFESLPNGWKMTVIEGGRHNDLMEYPRYYDELDAFLDEVLE